MDLLSKLGGPSVVWFILGIIIFILEMVIPGFVLFFFGMGAWLTAIVCLFIDISLDTQLLIFIISSILFFATMRKFVKKLFSGKKDDIKNTGENTDDFIGTHAVVVESIIPPRRGKVELHGTNWNAEADTEIQQGAMVEIISKQNITLKVKQI